MKVMCFDDRWRVMIILGGVRWFTSQQMMSSVVSDWCVILVCGMEGCLCSLFLG